MRQIFKKIGTRLNEKYKSAILTALKAIIYAGGVCLVIIIALFSLIIAFLRFILNVFTFKRRDY